jgi:hypothetical protein
MHIEANAPKPALAARTSDSSDAPSLHEPFMYPYPKPLITAIRLATKQQQPQQPNGSDAMTSH